jgi:hypothetical protein
MSRITLCDPPAGWKERIKELNDREPPVDGTILLGVELALELAWLLGYQSETPLVVPALLSGTPMYGLSYSKEQRLAIANVRQILPYSSSSAWRTDLAAYRLLPNEWRHYDFPLGNNSSVDAKGNEEPNDEKDDWEKRLLCIARKPEALQRHKVHNQLYHRCLTTRLPFHKRSGAYAVSGKTYIFRAELTDGEREEIRVQFPQELLDKVNTRSHQWFDFETERVREPIIIDLQRDLAPIAKFFDESDKNANRPSEQWQSRLEKIKYCPVNPEGKVSTLEANVLHLDGFHHAAGMVASGKSTLAVLLAGFIAKEHPQKRITLAIGDNQTMLRLVNQINRYFRKSPITDAPVAVPLMGRRSRSRHLRNLHGTADWQDHWAHNEAHWGERFLSTACPLQGLIEPNQIAVSYRGHTIQPGQEPCASLTLLKQSKTGRIGTNGHALAKERVLCPLYDQCPVHRATHDMFHAPIWITTPQAMTRGSLPRQAEARPVHIGEIVYEQSDIVVVDEADAVMGVLDETFAQEEDLTNGKRGKGGGIYDRVGDQTERFVIPMRATMTRGQLRWSQAQRGGQNACQILLSLLNDDSLPFLKEWVYREYFTPYALFCRLSRRLAGLPENAPHDESRDAKSLADECMEPFVQLFGRTVSDALTPHRVRDEHERRQRLQVVERDEPAYELWQLLRDIDAEGDQIFHEAEVLVARCKVWITDTYPEWPEQAQKLRERLKQEAQAAKTEVNEVTGKETKRRANRRAKAKEREAAQVDTLDHLAYRLLFALTAALLDRHTYIILAEWTRRTAPDEDDTQPHQNTPAILRDILPVPPIGRQFGTYYSPGDSLSGSNPNRLSFLSYTNMGRSYLLHFHELFSDLRQHPGPNVLALSGTSYLPDAIRLHLGSFHTKPQGLLLPEKEAMRAIGKSEFTFLPLRDGDGLPIRISGAKEGHEKVTALQSLARKLVGHDGGYLRRELATLQTLEQNDKALWADRSRILLLVNSYDQARIVATTLQDAWHEEKERIFYLSRVEGENNDVLGGGKLGSVVPANALNRPDIETFGTHTEGRILVAPMSAIGRGYNILNKNGKAAAFGALYFLIRPYPHPDDMTALAREMNRRTLDWADKENFAAWNAASLQEKFQNLRRVASDYWDMAQRRQYWSTLHDYPEWDCAPRKDLAAYTAGLLVQAAGRLLRGGVPFRAYFVDAAFAMQAARHPDEEPADTIAVKDSPQTSLLAAVIVLMRNLVCCDPIARELYEPLANALCDTRFRDGAFPFDDHWNTQEKNK